MRRRLPVVLFLLALLVAAVGFLRVVVLSSPPAAPADAGAPRRVTPGPQPVAPRRIVGRVVAGGAPFAGARVRLEPPDGETTSGADGGFVLPARAGAAYRVVASADGKRPAVAQVAAGESGPLELALGECPRRVSGVVRDASGGTIAGAVLALRATAATSQDDGRYALCVLDGASFLRVTAGGYGGVGVDAFDAAARDLLLVPEGVVRGRVLRAADRQPVAGARVRARAPGEERYGGVGTVALDGEGASDEQGRFAIDGLAPGRYLLEVVAPGLWQPATPAAVVLAGKETEEILITLAPASLVRGRVVRDGAPAPGLRVELRAARGSRSAVSDASGAFAIADVPPGEHEVRVERHDVLAPARVTVDQREPREVVVTVRARGAIRGVVLRDGRPAAGVAVRAYGGGREYESWPDVTSGADGAFELTGTGEGRFTVWAEDLASGAKSRDAVVDLAQGASREGVTLELTLRGAVAGVVVDPLDHPVVDALVTLARGGWHTSATVDDRGRFEILGLEGAPAPLAIAVSAGRDGPRYEPATPFPPVELPDASARVEGLRLVVKPLARPISGVVLDPGGAPAADVTVSAQAMEGGPPIFGPSFGAGLATVSDAEGRFALARVGGGPYALCARAADGAEARLQPVSPGDARVVLRLARTGAIAGSLAGFQRPPRVAVTTEGGPLVDATVVGNGFHAERLYPGRYRVTATGDGVQISAETEVVSGGLAQVTLRAPGRGRVRGRVVEVGTLAPVAGLDCGAVSRAVRRLDAPEIETDADGRFEVPDVPAGEVDVWCRSRERRHAVTAATATVAEGGTADVELTAVGPPGDGHGWIGLVLGFGGREGVRVRDVVADSPAARAGIAAGDGLVAIDGFDLAGTELGGVGASYLIGRHAPGFPVSLTVRHGATTRTLRVVPTEPPAR